MEKIYIKIKRQDQPQSASYWEDFEVPARLNMNVISVLREIQKNPVNTKGAATSSVVWEASCLEEICGSCTLLINGKVSQACSALIDQLDQPITLEPLTKFPVVRDLVVDRSRVSKDLQKTQSWIPVQGRTNGKIAQKINIEEQASLLELAGCIECGSCLEVCPEYHSRSPFKGAVAISQTDLLNKHPTGRLQKADRLELLMEEGGLDSCGHAQNCVKACPKEIPLTTSIARMGREVTKQALGKLFGK